MALQPTIFSPHDVGKSTFFPVPHWCPLLSRPFPLTRAEDHPPDLDSTGVISSLFHFSACICVPG